LQCRSLFEVRFHRLDSGDSRVSVGLLPYLGDGASPNPDSGLPFSVPVRPEMAISEGNGAKSANSLRMGRRNAKR
jgi:hypothetical protein